MNYKYSVFWEGRYLYKFDRLVKENNYWLYDYKLNIFYWVGGWEENLKILFNCNILGIIALEMVEGKLFYGDIYFMRVCFLNIEFM